MSIQEAIKEIRKGNFILLHDSNDREDETDMVIAAEFVKPEHIAKMRQYAGGLICVAVSREIAKKLSLPFMAEILKFSEKKFQILKRVRAYDIPYDEKSAFSIAINHRRTFTGISDNDRALTISEFAKFCKNIGEMKNPKREFGKIFRSPGHVPLLISSGIEKRQGHTELSIELLKKADVTPVAVICEILDSQSYKSLSVEKAKKFAKMNKIVFIDGSKIK